MPRPRLPPDSIAGRSLAPSSDCSWTEGGLNAAWVRRRADGALPPVDRSVQALLRLDETDGS